MHCAAIMSVDHPTVQDNETVAEAVVKLIRNQELSLPVIDADGCFVGMFGVDDFLSLIVPRVALAGDVEPNLRFVEDDPEALSKRFGAIGKRNVAETADKRAATLSPDAPQLEAFRMLCRDGAPLAIVEPATGRFLGMVRYWDVMRAMAG